jgi:hypothetical protein
MVDFDDELDFEWYFRYTDFVRTTIWENEYLNTREKITRENIDIDDFSKVGGKWQVHWSVVIPNQWGKEADYGMICVPTYEEWKLELIAKHRENALKVLGI